MVAYDAQVIQDFAEDLYRRARRIVVSSTVLGVLLGAVLGAALGVYLSLPIVYTGGVLEIKELAWPLAGLGIGAVLFGLLGNLSARSRAQSLRLQAQVALCQVQIEQNTRGGA